MASNIDVDTDEEINEVLNELGSKKMNKENRLSGMRTYLAGPIDHAKEVFIKERS